VIFSERPLAMLGRFLNPTTREGAHNGYGWKNGGACDFSSPPHRSPPQSQRPRALAMEAGFPVDHGVPLILDN
jgi:hypothetical protein